MPSRASSVRPIVHKPPGPNPGRIHAEFRPRLERRRSNPHHKATQKGFYLCLLLPAQSPFANYKLSPFALPAVSFCSHRDSKKENAPNSENALNRWGQRDWNQNTPHLAESLRNALATLNLERTRSTAFLSSPGMKGDAL